MWQFVAALHSHIGSARAPPLFYPECDWSILQYGCERKYIVGIGQNDINSTTTTTSTTPATTTTFL